MSLLGLGTSSLHTLCTAVKAANAPLNCHLDKCLLMRAQLVEVHTVNEVVSTCVTTASSP